MAFPDISPATPDAAFAAMSNRLLAAGLSIPATLDRMGTVYSALANMTAALPAAVNSGRILPSGAGAGITAGVGTIYKTRVSLDGGIIQTDILIDITGLASVATDLDIIGAAAGGAANIGQITAAVNGTILGGFMTCLEVPVGGAVDIDLYAATVGTGAYDEGIATLVETAVVTSGGNWTLGRVLPLLVDTVAADSYLYLTSGAATAGTMTAGRFLITMYGY